MHYYKTRFLTRFFNLKNLPKMIGVKKVTLSIWTCSFGLIAMIRVIFFIGTSKRLFD